MLCIKGFADPLCYLLSLLSPGPAQLLGKIKLLGCNKTSPKGKMPLLGAEFATQGPWSPSWVFPRSYTHWKGPCREHRLCTRAERMTHCQLEEEVPTEPVSHCSARHILWSYLVLDCSWWVTVFAGSSPPMFLILLPLCPWPDPKIHALALSPGGLFVERVHLVFWILIHTWLHKNLTLNLSLPWFAYLRNGNESSGPEGNEVHMVLWAIAARGISMLLFLRYGQR